MLLSIILLCGVCCCICNNNWQVLLSQRVHTAVTSKLQDLVCAQRCLSLADSADCTVKD